MPTSADRRLPLVPATARLIRTLWSGGMPLKRAFWDFAIIGGFLVNLVATLAMLALLAEGAPVAVPLIVHCLPMPYNVLMLVAVWRSAGAYELARPERRLWAHLARGTIVIWTLAATLL